MPDFLLRAFLGGLGVVLVAGPLGCFIVWRRMAYFGDSLAHSALLGIALGFLLGINVTVGIAAAAITMALLLVLLQQQRQLASDTLLGLLSHSGLALGLVVLSFFESLRVDLLSYLFGDVLAVTYSDLLWIYGGGLVALFVLAAIWRPLLFTTLNEELARAEGVPVTAVRLALMLVIALVIAVAMKVVGILLITSLLIIPAATARRFAETPERMAAIAVVIGALALAGGLLGSLQWDTPSGPSVVVAAMLLFAASVVVGAFRSRFA
ncbi:MAG: zinc ABC transporter permease subunit ZnuB [Kiloniellales bacterium]|nr:zinc ABC transporter permease subunit ZnuB [Kiloniellales bacterium]